MKDMQTIERQLDRVLGFFPRVETRINALFGVNTVILAVGALNVAAPDLKLWYVSVPGAFALAGLLISYIFLYRANFPDVKGGQGSLIYFAEIQNRTEPNYQSELEACSDDQFRKDLVGQVWRNSQILCAKYVAVKIAIIATTLSLVPFFIFLAVTASIHVRLPIFNG
ncbi:Pycsar system effector family protein [Brevundimonas abyssalis]|uniref:Pycsar effector protein domain-containing protein n=1 Tax=Brevundimonas abyssalis TAR-001 TaxID=1391729 RepID=A0A8E0KKW8_9CAUL|nr:Pycsar system effector family protein [Brevundimonas abyssalis]GAD58292.1 hypothetical protein MBEBAB_0542 [Brevundimonas abyssalis TAR-001]